MSTKLRTVRAGDWLWLVADWIGGRVWLHRQGRVGSRIRPGQRARVEEQETPLQDFTIYTNIFTRGSWRTEGTVVRAASAEAARDYYAGGLVLDPNRVKAVPAAQCAPGPGWLDQ